MQRLRLSTVGAVCAILTPILFFAGGILLGTSSGQDLIPQTGADGLEWIADVDDAGDLFFVGAWLIVLVTLVGSVALGNALGWAVEPPLYGVAILTTGAVPRWLGWLALAAAAIAGWLGLLSPASSVIEGITVIGFLGFFVFMIGMGIAVLRRQRSAAV